MVQWDLGLQSWARHGYDHYRLGTQFSLKSLHSNCPFLLEVSTVSRIPFYGQVIQQPAGTYTPQEHSVRVAPLFAEPILAFLLYYGILGAMHLWDKRDKRRVDILSKKLRKMVAELKVRPAFLLEHSLC